MGIASAIARKLLEIKAIKLSPQEPFTWASGILSPIYCDNRIALSHPDKRNFIKNSFIQKANDFGDYDVIAGVATAGIPHGAILADALSKPFIYVRSKAKGHGRQNLIEGEAPSGAKVLVIEDLISTGGSSLQAVDALRVAGFEVIGVMAIFTYGFDQSREAFEKANCKLETLTSYEFLLKEAEEMGYIKNEDQELLTCLLYTSPSPRDATLSRMPSSA